MKRLGRYLQTNNSTLDSAHLNREDISGQSHCVYTVLIKKTHLWMIKKTKIHESLEEKKYSTRNFRFPSLPLMSYLLSFVSTFPQLIFVMGKNHVSTNDLGPKLVVRVTL